MKRKGKFILLSFCVCVCVLFSNFVLAQDGIISSIKFKDTDIKIVLESISEKASKEGERVNIVVGPGVTGPVTINLESVDWVTALDVIVKTYNYGYEWIGETVILVDTFENLAEKRQKALEAKEIEALDTRVFSLSFAKVETIKPTIEGMLSSRGKLNVDERTNTLVITDVQSNLSNLAKTIATLDSITAQVLIEAKIVEINLDVTHKIGIDWDITGIASAGKRPHSWPFSSSSDNKYAKADAAFPVAGGATFGYGTLNASGLQATLDIIFDDTDTNILSMPKITVLNNETATINVKTEDPVPNFTYNKDSDAWEISGFEKYEYGVSLEVTPQINQEGYITLDVKPEVNEKLSDKTFTSGSGLETTVPVLTTQKTQTKVMIKDGETLIIAGLIRDKTTDVVKKVPLLGDIPYLGYFFKHKSTTKVKKNLLVFITPTIVTPTR
ncbi:MAG: hypothetical protein KAI91_00305 [Candidatus Omnitrophica bacterium]|nr:hypothetical protein [Candidatus Omnitrophota bacterium]